MRGADEPADAPAGYVEGFSGWMGGLVGWEGKMEMRRGEGVEGGSVPDPTVSVNLAKSGFKAAIRVNGI